MSDAANTSVRSVSKNSVWYLSAAVFGNLYVLVTLPLISASLTKLQLSQYLLIVQFVMLFQMAATSLFSSPIIRFRPKLDHPGQSALFLYALTGVLALHVCMYLTSGLPGIEFLGKISPLLEGISRGTFELVTCWSLVLAARSVSVSFLKSLERPKSVFATYVAFAISIVLLLLHSLSEDVSVHAEDNLLTIFRCLIIAEAIALCFALSRLKAFFSFRIDLLLSVEVMKFALPLLPGALCLSLTLGADILLAGIFLPANDLAYYGVASSIGKGFGLLVGALISAYSARLVSVFESGGRGKLQEVALALSQQNTLVLSVALVGCASVAFKFFDLLFTPTFASEEKMRMSIVFFMVCAALFLRGIYQVQANLLLIQNRTNLMLSLSTGIALITYSICLTGATYFGFFGLPSGIFAGYLVALFMVKKYNSVFVEIKIPFISIALLMGFCVLCLYANIVLHNYIENEVTSFLFPLTIICVVTIGLWRFRKEAFQASPSKVPISRIT